MEKIQKINPRLKDIKASENELISLLDGLLLPIEKMEWWLLKNTDLYNVTENIYYKEILIEQEDGTLFYFPEDSIFTDEYWFKDLFEALEEISRLYKSEGYFKKEIEHYNKVSTSITEVKKWVVKNEKFGTLELFFFNIECLDNIDDKDEISVYNKNDWDIYVDKEKFKHTIGFFAVFHNLFWIKKVYPESEILLDLLKT